MKEIQLKTGTAIIPGDWIKVSINPTGNEAYIVVVEMRGGEFPDFYFLSDSESINAETEDAVLSAIVAQYPWFKTDVLDKQVEAEHDESGKCTNEAELNAAPTIGFFVIADAGIPHEFYPFDAKVIRTAQESRG